MAFRINPFPRKLSVEEVNQALQDRTVLDRNRSGRVEGKDAYVLYGKEGSRLSEPYQVDIVKKHSIFRSRIADRKEMRQIKKDVRARIKSIEAGEVPDDFREIAALYDVELKAPSEEGATYSVVIPSESGEPQTMSITLDSYSRSALARALSDTLGVPYSFTPDVYFHDTSHREPDVQYHTLEQYYLGVDPERGAIVDAETNEVLLSFKEFKGKDVESVAIMGDFLWGSSPIMVEYSDGTVEHEWLDIRSKRISTFGISNGPRNGAFWDYFDGAIKALKEHPEWGIVSVKGPYQYYRDAALALATNEAGEEQLYTISFKEGDIYPSSEKDVRRYQGDFANAPVKEPGQLTQFVQF